MSLSPIQEEVGLSDEWFEDEQDALIMAIMMDHDRILQTSDSSLYIATDSSLSTITDDRMITDHAQTILQQAPRPPPAAPMMNLNVDYQDESLELSLDFTEEDNEVSEIQEEEEIQTTPRGSTSHYRWYPRIEFIQIVCDHWIRIPLATGDSDVDVYAIINRYLGDESEASRLG